MGVEEIELATRLVRDRALSDFRYFVLEVNHFDGRRGLTHAEHASFVRSAGWLPVPDFSDTAYDEVFDALHRFDVEKGMQLLLLLPRGTGKTTLIQAFVLWLCLRNASDRIGVFTSTATTAASFLSTIRDWVLKVPRDGMYDGELRHVFGDRMPEPGQDWGNAAYLRFPGWRSTGRELGTVMVFGTGQTATGYHFRVLIGEDLVDDESSNTDAAIDATKAHWQHTTGLEIGGDSKKMVVGTCYTDADLHAEMRRTSAAEVASGRTPTVTVIRLPCRVERADGSYDHDCKPRFRHLDDATLRKRLLGAGSYFYAGQWDLDPVPIVGGMFNIRWLLDHLYDDDEIYETKSGGAIVKDEQGRATLKPEFSAVNASDLAVVARKGHDNSAHLAGAMGPTGHLYLLGSCKGKYTEDQNTTTLGQYLWNFRSRFVLMEKGTITNFYDGIINRHNRNNPDRPIVYRAVAGGGARGTYMKDRALLIRAMAERGEIHLPRDPRRHGQMLTELMRYTPNADNTEDDMVAALALLCMNRAPWGAKKADEEKPAVGIVQAIVGHHLTESQRGAEREWD